MVRLWQILGYDEIAKRIAQGLEDAADITLIEGPPGVGKSWLAKGLGAMWEESGGVAVVIQGDSLKSDASLYPFESAMARLPKRWRVDWSSVKPLAQAGELVVGTAGIVTATVETAARAHRGHQRNRGLVLGDSEQEVMFSLEKLGRKRPLLLVADNLHWWDPCSLRLLAALADPDLIDTFPFLEHVRILAVQTLAKYQPIASPAAHEALLRPLATRTETLGKVPKEGFDEVLCALNADCPRPSVTQADAIHSLTSGHLALASRCTERLVTGEIDSFLEATSADDFLGRLVAERFRTLGPRADQALDLLQVAAILGLTFRRMEAACASRVEDAEIPGLMRFCREEQVLELSEDDGFFVHDVYRRHFLDLAREDSIDIHERLTECLRTLRPGAYDLRCLNSIEAEQSRGAATFGVQAALQIARDGRPASELPEAIENAIHQGGLDQVLQRLIRAMNERDCYEFKACIQTLDSLPRDLPKPLRAESDYIRAMCLMSTRSEDDRAIARSTLEAWKGLEEEEPELGVRLMSLLLYGYFHLVDKDPGRSLEGRINQVLLDRVNFDPTAKDALYVLDRSAGGLYPTDIAVIRNREAVDHFAPESEGGLLRRPREYYRCLVNYGANLINNGDYGHAKETYDQVEALIGQYPPAVFPRLDYPRMNHLLASFRLGEVSTKEAAVAQRSIVESLGAENDSYYSENALAVYLALAGDTSEALAIFDRLERRLFETRSRPEASMVYLLRSNRAVARFSSGDMNEALREWEELSQVAQETTYVGQDSLLTRHEALLNIMNERRPMTATELDLCLLDRDRFGHGPSWRESARAFTMWPIEFWRES